MDIKKIKQLISIVEHANISHLSLEHDNQKIEIKKEFSAGTTQVVMQQPSMSQMPMQVAAPAQAASSVASVVPAAPAARDANLIPIKAQMVGTFYHSPNPESPAYVKVGDSIKQGQVICIVEAMKLFNEIESDISGVIEKVCIESGTPVEYGQELFLVRV